MQQDQEPNSLQRNQAKVEEPDVDVSVLQKLVPQVSDNEVDQAIMRELSKRREKLR